MKAGEKPFHDPACSYLDVAERCYDRRVEKVSPAGEISHEGGCYGRGHWLATDRVTKRQAVSREFRQWSVVGLRGSVVYCRLNTDMTHD